MQLKSFCNELKPGPHYVFQVSKNMQNDPKDEDSELKSFVLWVFLHDSNGAKDIA